MLVLQELQEASPLPLPLPLVLVLLMVLEQRQEESLHNRWESNLPCQCPPPHPWTSRQDCPR
jgi:hypothetical protein